MEHPRLFSDLPLDRKLGRTTAVSYLLEYGSRSSEWAEAGLLDVVSEVWSYGDRKKWTVEYLDALLTNAMEN